MYRRNRGFLSLEDQIKQGRPIRSSTVDECLSAHAEFVETLGRLPISQLDRFKALIEQDLGAVFTSQ